MLLQPAGQKRHAKSRVIDIGIAADEDDVKLAPAAALGLLHGHR